MGKKIDITGQKFGKLTVIEESGIPNKSGIIWKCLCICGNITNVRASHLKYGETISCGCARKDRLFNGYKNISGTFYNEVKQGAKARDIEFDITKEYLYKIFESQNFKCNLSGIDIQISDICGDNSKKLYHSKTTASVDRIDNNIGYIEGNIQFVHKYVNKIKNIFSDEQVIYYCNLVTHPLTNQSNTKQIVSQTFYTKCKYKSKQRNIDFNLSKEECQKVFDTQEWLCKYTNIPITISDNITASIDRIDSNKKYDINNIQFVHRIINRMKWTLSDTDFRYYCRLINEYNNEK